MNTDTGHIEFMRDILGKEMDAMSLHEQQEGLAIKNYVPIDPKDMTRKQRRESKVSLNNHRSVLGKQLTAIQQRKRVFGR